MNKELDLSIIADRRKYIDDLGVQFIQELRDINLNISENAKAKVDSYMITFGTRTGQERFFDWCSEIKLYATENLFGNVSIPKFSSPTSGSFDPLKDSAQYWRYVHAGELIKSWVHVSLLIDKYVQMHRDLSLYKVDQSHPSNIEYLKQKELAKR